MSRNPYRDNDRMNKSDAEDKSLSNDETPPPSCPRQPPDGDEMPSDVVEKLSDTTRLPPRIPASWQTTRTRLSYSRNQDVRSECSVKDKIAMFSNDRVLSSDRLDKNDVSYSRNTVNLTRKSICPHTNNYSEVSSLDRRLTKSQDNLDDVHDVHKRIRERPEVLGAVENTRFLVDMPLTKLNRVVIEENIPVFYGSTTNLPSVKQFPNTDQIYHARSVSDDNGKNSHRSNLEYLIEQRKKSMSKLRGLVIPETQGPIVDLPEIKIQGNVPKTLFENFNTRTDNRPTKQNSRKTINLNETLKTNILSNNIPKYSPAFKRKSLQVYAPFSLVKASVPERKLNITNNSDIKVSNKVVPSKPPRSSIDLKRTSDKLVGSDILTRISATNATTLKNGDYKNEIHEISSYRNVEVKVCTATDIIDSDNDSAMSSTQSSYRSSASSPLHNMDSIESDSSHLSPRSLNCVPYTVLKSEITNKSSTLTRNNDKHDKRSVIRSLSSDTNLSASSSAGSAATSGSQASCSSLESTVQDLESKKGSKTSNIDAINRRNVLASAKCRSGRDIKLSSPVIETKFSHENHERPQSPQQQLSDRLSTLTKVSATTNKGDNRRLRNKVVNETDSDSDIEVSIRQRKPDFKNSRLKKNATLQNKHEKNKGSNLSPEISVALDEASQVITKRIIKEIKKAGLDDFRPEERTIDTYKLKEPTKSKVLQKKIEPKAQDVKPKLLSLDISRNIRTLSINNNEKDKEPTKTVPPVPVADIKKISTRSSYILRLQKGAGVGIGLILAGGIDCENKEVTVHRVLVDSIAERAGLKRGARVRSINGYVTAGLTHAQTVAVLKEPHSEVTLEIENEIQETVASVVCGSEIAESKVRDTTDSAIGAKEVRRASKINNSVVTVVLEKAGAGVGLGFGLDGGRDSPKGDRPLTIKKLFAGGAAACSGNVLVGAELLSAGGQQMEGLTRTQAWSALKALPPGPVTIVLRNSVKKCVY